MSECRCGKPTRDDAYVCDDCSTGLSRALGDIAWLDDELETTITRQRAATYDGSTSGTGDKPLPWHERAADARRTLHGLLVSWVRFCDEEDIRGIPQWQARDNLTSLARWMLHCVRGLSLHDIGPDAVDEITDAVAECERVVFWKRRSRTYLGPCGQKVTDEWDEVVTLACPGEVYAEENADVGTCDECGQGVTVAIRKADLNKQLDDRLCTAAEIARLSTYLGLDVPRDRVRKQVNTWHARKLVTPASKDHEGNPLFRYGAVRTLLYATYVTRRDAS